MSGIDSMIGGTIAGAMLGLSLIAIDFFIKKARTLAHDNRMLREHIKELEARLPKDSPENELIRKKLRELRYIETNPNVGFLGFTSSV